MESGFEGGARGAETGAGSQETQRRRRESGLGVADPGAKSWGGAGVRGGWRRPRLESRARKDGGDRETGVCGAQRRRLESRQHEDGGWSPDKAETETGSEVTKSWRLEPGGRGDCGWSLEGDAERTATFRRAQRRQVAGVGGAAKLTAPSHHARGSPSQAASSRAGGPQSHKLKWGTL